ncbi:MAG: methyl-accepting chemotaxis protein [Coriobacteriia bacterium]|nr:methyl-accepting chemotaxis protein [Coriobacteriia bacterium]
MKRDTGTRLLVTMLFVGLAIGVAFPLVAGVFVVARGPSAWLVFSLLSIASGLGLGACCYLIAIRTSRTILAGVLADATAAFGATPSASKDLREMRRRLEQVFERGQGSLERMRDMGGRVRDLSSEILTVTEEQASGAAEQAAAVTQTSATLEELAQTSKQIAENSESVVRIAETTLASAEEGMTAVHDTSEGIEEIRLTTQQSSDRILALAERSQEIGRVLTIIDEIAEQTKILALNAAIEAARAGEAGKGFAVVAEEIRKLADSVTESTQEIGRVVREIQASTSGLIMATERAAKKVDEGKSLAQRTADSLDRIVHQVEQTTDAAKQISIATQQQRTASEQVVVSMREVALVSQQAAEASRNISAATYELKQTTESASA